MRPTRLLRAFTLIELTVVIAIIAILAGALLPVLTQPYIQERRSETIKEMAAIEEATMGRPELGDWGFLGTIGRPPANVLELLNPVPTALTALRSDNGVARGWNGPYMRVATNDPTRDAWGGQYAINTDAGGGWQIQSAGPNGVMGTALAPDTDDIFLPVDQPTRWASRGTTVTVELDLANGPNLLPVSDASVTSATLTIPDKDTRGADKIVVGTVAGSKATFTGIPFGIHVLTVGLTGYTPATVVRPVVVRRPVTLTQVALPVSANPILGTCATGLVPVGAGTSVISCSPAAAVTVLTGQIVTMTISGAFRSRAPTSTCYLAPYFDVPNADPAVAAIDLSQVNASMARFSAAMTTSQGSDSFSVERSFLMSANGGTLDLRFLLQGTGAGGCQIDAANVIVKAWPP